MQLRLAVVGSLLAAIVMVASGPTHATCDMPRIISSLFPRGTESYIYTPGVNPGETSSSITADFEGFFWSLGNGHPSYRQGRDNGAFVARGEDGWVQHPLGYPATIETTWAAAGQIDGCIDDTVVAIKCTVVLLSDQVSGRGYFAALTARDVIGNYYLAQPNNAPITLAAIGEPVISSTSTLSSTETRVTLKVDEPNGGLFLTTECTDGVVAGYRVYFQKSARGAAAPTDLRRQQSGGWKLAPGGETSAGLPISLGALTAVTSTCTATEDLYLSASLVFDSGFETAHVSRPTGPIQCGVQ